MISREKEKRFIFIICILLIIALMIRNIDLITQNSKLRKINKENETTIKLLKYENDNYKAITDEKLESLSNELEIYKLMSIDYKALFDDSIKYTCYPYGGSYDKD